MAILNGFKDTDLGVYIDGKVNIELDKQIDFKAEIKGIRRLK